MPSAAAPSALVRRLRAPGYLILGIAIVFPIVDYLLSVAPLRPATVMWRFGAVGLLSNAIGAPLLVLFFMYALAYFSGDRKVMILCAVLAAVIALLMIGGTGTFALDALQMKRRVQAAAQPKYLVGSGEAIVKLVLEGLAAIVLAVSALRSARGAKAASVLRTEARASSSLLMGRASAPRPVATDVVAGPAAPIEPVND